MPDQTVPASGVTPAGVILAELASAAELIVEHWTAAAADQVSGHAVRMAGLALAELLAAELSGEPARAGQRAAEILDIADTAADIAESADAGPLADQSTVTTPEHRDGGALGPLEVRRVVEEIIGEDRGVSGPELLAARIVDALFGSTS